MRRLLFAGGTMRFLGETSKWFRFAGRLWHEVMGVADLCCVATHRLGQA